MTPEEINKAMAELDGWRPTAETGVCAGYTKDLNAVARVVPKLSRVEHIAYGMTLARVCVNSRYAPLDATAPQRCEAILRAVGKWVYG